MTQRVNNCELCCDVLSKELPCFDVSQDKSMKIIIGFIVPYLDIGTLEKFVICTNCCRCLQQLEQIWVSYSETEKQIRLFKQVRAEIGVPNENPLTLGDLLAFHRDGEVRINIENQSYCRLCLQWVPGVGYEFNSNSVHYVMLKNISRCWDFTSTSDPIICDICQTTIEKVYSFREKCLNARNPIKFQAEGMSDGEDFDVDDDDEDLDREFSKIEINDNDIKMQVVNINSASHAYSCMYCSYVTPVQSYFKRHSRTKHRGQDGNVIIKENEPLSCNMCSFKTRVPSDLKIHIRNVHGEPASDRTPRDEDEAPAIVDEVPEESVQSIVPPEKGIVLRKSLRLSLKNSKANCIDKNDKSKESTSKKCTEIKDVVDTSVSCRHLKANRFGNMFECMYACKKKSSDTRKRNSETHSGKCSVADHKKPEKNKRNSKESPSVKENRLEKQAKSKNYQIIYKCIRCPLETVYKSSLKRHLRRVHNESLAFADNVCNAQDMPKNSPKKKTIPNQKHNNMKDFENEKRYNQNMEKNDSKLLKRRDQVAYDKGHQKVIKDSPRNNGRMKNEDIKSRQIIDGKKSAVSNKNNVKISQERHVSTVSENKSKQSGFKKPFQCSFCSYATKRRKYLKTHETALHSENAPVYDCSLCNFKSKWERALKKHKKSKRHLDNVALKCR